MRNSWVWFLFWLCACTLGYGQDPHFSQSHLSPLHLNPALTGSSTWDQRMGAHWKEQWVKVPVNYQTFSLWYDQKLRLPWLPVDGLAGGVVFLHDRAGDSELSWTQLGARVSYRLIEMRGLRLFAGLGADVGQRALQASQLRFADQFNGEFFDPTLLSQESLANESRGFLSLQAGINLQLVYDRNRSLLSLGLSAAHLNQPTITFFDEDDVNVPLITRFNMDGIVQVHDEWDVTVRQHLFMQGTYLEYLLSVGARFHWNRQPEPIKFGLALGHRLGDAWIPQLEVLYEQWRFGLSYDINTSDFQTATNGRGGLELALHYYLLQPKPPEEFKSCPIF